MVCFVSSRTLRKKHIVTCFFLPKGKPYEMDKTGLSMFEILEPGGGGQLRQIQHLRGLNSMALGYLNLTAGLTLFLFTYITTLGSQ